MPDDSRSALWRMIAGSVEDAVEDLDSFRSPGGVNRRLAHWDAREPTYRWFKSYLQLAVATTPQAERDLLASLGNHDLGAPITVASAILQDPSVVLRSDLDYLYAAEETSFIQRSLTGSGAIQSICELGAGFGRTAHLLITATPQVDRYVIVDLAETLKLSRAYLAAVLTPAQLRKIEFRDVRSVGADSSWEAWDLFIQIDGFQEMDEAVIEVYQRHLAGPSQFCFISNPIGKYDPETAGVEGIDPEGLAHAMRLGRSRTLVDPWDEESLRLARPKHLQEYQPPGHTLIRAEPSRLRPYYLHAMYARTVS